MKASQAYRLLVAAGFRPAAAVTMTAIGGAESGWNPNAIGDVALETPVWGPSVGIWQIRTLKADTGKGGPRDINALRGNAAAQARAAHAIWSGSGFGAWTTFNNGAYRRFLGGAHSASTAAPGPTAGTRLRGRHGRRNGALTLVTDPATAGGTAQAFSLRGGGILNPLNWPGALAGGVGGAAGDAAGSVAGALWSQVQPFLVTSMFAVAGLGLVVIGVTVTAKPLVKPLVDDTNEKAGQIAQAAPMLAAL